MSEWVIEEKTEVGSTKLEARSRESVLGSPESGVGRKKREKQPENVVLTSPGVCSF